MGPAECSHSLAILVSLLSRGRALVQANHFFPRPWARIVDLSGIFIVFSEANVVHNFILDREMGADLIFLIFSDINFT